MNQLKLTLKLKDAMKAYEGAETVEQHDEAVDTIAELLEIADNEHPNVRTWFDDTFSENGELYDKIALR